MSTASGSRSRLARWTVVVPVLALVVLVATWGSKPGWPVLAVAGAFLAGSVLTAVHHAEVVAHRVGEPFGSLVLAIAVTTIEVGLIVTLMVSGAEGTRRSRATPSSRAVMITCNGIVGLSLLIGALRRGLAAFNAEGTATALATVATLATLSLVLPTFTTSRPGREFSPAQLAFAAVASLALYGLFVVVQTVRHHDDFLPVSADRAEAAADAEHVHLPSRRDALESLGLLLVALISVVGVAKLESPAIEDAVAAIGAPQSAVGVVIALLVLLRATPGATACRRASTLRSARRWRASASRSR